MSIHVDLVCTTGGHVTTRPDLLEDKGAIELLSYQNLDMYTKKY